jgi:mRNA interferase MazF
MTASKVRPAVCLTDPIGPHRHVVVAFITSQAPEGVFATDVVLDPQRRDFGATGLRVASVLRLHRLVTLNTTLIRRDMGKLSQAWQDEVDRKLALLFQIRNRQ